MLGKLMDCATPQVLCYAVKLLYISDYWLQTTILVGILPRNQGYINPYYLVLHTYQVLQTTIPGGILHTNATHNYTWWNLTHKGYTQLYLVVFYTQRLHTTIPGGILHTKVTHNYTWWYFTHKGYTQLYLVVFYRQ